jgi:tetratricopeptide (TPR) repeat protein
MIESNVAATARGDDDTVLERARTQWQFGDWESLAALDPVTFEHHPERAKLVLLSAAGHLQCERYQKAREYLQLAIKWGCGKKLIARVMVSSVHNSLGRAAAIDQRHEKAITHFEHALRAGSPGSETRLQVHARMSEQMAQLQLLNEGLLKGSSVSVTEEKLSYPHSIKDLDRRPAITAVLELGPAWSGNTVNTVIFRHHGVVTWGDYQYAAFYVDERHMRIVRRHLFTNTLETHDILGEFNLQDAHNSISLGVDRSGHIHISYDHHATSLRYRRSLEPESIGGWTDELPMTGLHEEQVTYPTFILPRAGHPLTLLYRDGTHNKGCARLKTYDEQKQIWVDRPEPILSGSDQKPWTSNAYWNHPAIGSDGSLHLSFVWRTGVLGEKQLVNNINIGYAWSPDNGLNWFTPKGLPYVLPITQVNAEVVWPIPPGSNLINQTSMALDSANRPHIIFYANDAQGIPQYQRIWFDGRQWQHQIVTQRVAPFNLTGSGTLQIPISRPEILIDAQDRVYAIGRGDFSQDCLVALRLDGVADGNAVNQSLWSEPLGFAEPVLDRTRWQRDRALSLFIQKSNQPNGDSHHEVSFDTAWLIDIELQEGGRV